MKTHRSLCFSFFLTFVTLATAFSSLCNIAEAAITVIDFEEFVGSPTFTPPPANFHGVTFSSDFGVFHWQGGQGHSGDMALTANRFYEGFKECSFTFTTPGRRFLGAWVQVDAYLNTTVQFVLYRAGGVVGRSSVLSNTATSTFLASAYDGPVDSVGILGYRGRYCLDDLTYSDDPQTICTPHAAKAVAFVSSGHVTGATITDAGCGYTNAPLVVIQGGEGVGATATASISAGQVTNINFTSQGSGYTNIPKIIIASPPFVPMVIIDVSSVRVTQKVVLGRRYVLESSTNLITWNITGPPFTAESETIENEFDVNITGRFFRLRETP